MSTKAFFPCGGGSNLILEAGMKNQIFIVYQMGRLCGGAHEISGIKAPLFLCGGVGGWWCGVVKLNFMDRYAKLNIFS